MKYEITIWVSTSKNRGHYMDGGEKVIVELIKPVGRRHPQLSFTRMFFNYPEWDVSSQCSFSVNDAVLRKLEKIIREVRVSLHK